jgi:hypothetical protein
MISVCVGCEKIFSEKLNHVIAKQLPQITCDTPGEEAHMYLNSDCIYQFDEDDYYGCTDFILCDKCFSDNKTVENVLENYKMLYGF